MTAPTLELSSGLNKKVLTLAQGRQSVFILLPLLLITADRVLACLPLSEALSRTWLASTDPSLSGVDVLGPILR